MHGDNEGKPVSAGQTDIHHSSNPLWTQSARFLQSLILKDGTEQITIVNSVNQPAPSHGVIALPFLRHILLRTEPMRNRMIRGPQLERILLGLPKRNRLGLLLLPPRLQKRIQPFLGFLRRVWLEEGQVLVPRHPDGDHELEVDVGDFIRWLRSQRMDLEMPDFSLYVPLTSSRRNQTTCVESGSLSLMTGRIRGITLNMLAVAFFWNREWFVSDAGGCRGCVLNNSQWRIARGIDDRFSQFLASSWIVGMFPGLGLEPVLADLSLFALPAQCPAGVVCGERSSAQLSRRRREAKA